MSHPAVELPSTFRHHIVAVGLLLAIAAIAPGAVMLARGQNEEGVDATVPTVPAGANDSADQQPRHSLAPLVPVVASGLPVTQRDPLVVLDWNSDQPRLHVVAADGRELVSHLLTKYAQAAVNRARAEVVTMERLASGLTEVKTIRLDTGEVSTLASTLPKVPRAPVYLPRAAISADSSVLYFVTIHSKLGSDARCDETRDARDCDEFSVVSFGFADRLAQQARVPAGCGAGIVFATSGSDAGFACSRGAVYSLSASDLSFAPLGNVPQRSDPSMREQTWVLGAWRVGDTVIALNSDGTVVSLASNEAGWVDHSIPAAGWRPISLVGLSRQYGGKLYVPVVRNYYEQHPARLAVVNVADGATWFVPLPDGEVESIQPVSETSLALVASGRLYRWDIGDTTMTPVVGYTVGTQARLVD